MSARLTSGFASFLSAAFLTLSPTGARAMVAPIGPITPDLAAMATPVVSAGLPTPETVSDCDAFIFADESGRLWLAVQVSPKTHNRAIFYVQSPLGLKIVFVGKDGAVFEDTTGTGLGNTDSIKDDLTLKAIKVYREALARGTGKPDEAESVRILRDLAKSKDVVITVRGTTDFGKLTGPYCSPNLYDVDKDGNVTEKSAHISTTIYFNPSSAYAEADLVHEATHSHDYMTGNMSKLEAKGSYRSPTGRILYKEVEIHAMTLENLQRHLMDPTHLTIRQRESYADDPDREWTPASESKVTAEWVPTIYAPDEEALKSRIGDITKSGLEKRLTEAGLPPNRATLETWRIEGLTLWYRARLRLSEEVARDTAKYKVRKEERWWRLF